MKATKLHLAAGAAAIAMVWATGQAAFAQQGASRSMPVDNAAAGNMSEPASARRIGDARDDVYDAMAVIQQAKADPRMQRVLQRARGVFIVHHYGRGAAGIGVQAGEGILLTRSAHGGFSNPVFYNLGGLSIGPQVGGSGGPMVVALMNERALQNFGSGQKFSLDADAALNVASLDKRAYATNAPVRDTVVWRSIRGAYVGASIGAMDVMFDRAENRAYYGRDDVSPRAILDGTIDNPHSNVLARALLA